MKLSFDKVGEQLTRKLARHSSRRGFLARFGAALVAAPVLPLLPVARGAAAEQAKSDAAGKRPQTDFERNAQATDDTKCTYWKYCGSDGVLCSCCGGGHHTCPPGAEPSPVSWVGTCVSPEDGKSYVIAYRDCCGKPVCAAGKACRCDNADRELPIYRAPLNNDIIWCFGNASARYHCSTAAMIAVAE
jgi:methylamine dehydrogenase light chain